MTMELEKFARQLKLLLLLTQNSSLSVEDISERLQMSRRSIYRYIDAFKTMGFIVRKKGAHYNIAPNSPFFEKIVTGIQFSEAEALTISEVLNSVYNNSPQVRHLREKLSGLYGTDVLARHGVDNRMASNVNRLFTAIQEERVVMLRNYTSPSSKTTANRIVEPYMFLNENSEVRCFELATGMNKTFKVSRTESVELMPLLWSHKAQHIAFFNDLFGFSGETRIPVSLSLGQLSMNVLLEEHPDAQRQLTPLPDGRYRLDTEVCGYKGVGRFVLGLYDDIDIIESPGFKDYVENCIKRYLGKADAQN